MKEIIKVSVILVCSIGSINQAMSWGLSDLDPTNKNSALRKGAKNIDPTNPNGNMGKDLHAKIKICNNARTTVNYKIGSNRSSLRHNYCESWQFAGQANISFDDGQATTKKYLLNDGKYTFSSFILGSPNALHKRSYIDLQRN